MNRRKPLAAFRRGLSLLELLLAISITAMVAGAISGMLGAVSSGVGARRDNRDTMVLAHAAQARLAAYLATARCALALQGDTLTIWFDDSRESGTVHASEIRWLRYDASEESLIVDYLEFPANWPKTSCELADGEYAAATNWDDVRTAYLAKGFIASRRLIDRLASLTIAHDEASAFASRHFTFDLAFVAEPGGAAGTPVQVSGTICTLETPDS